MIADSHAHLDMEQFEADREAVVARAVARGVALIITIGTGKPQHTSVQRTLEIAETYRNVRAGIGVHPHDASSADEGYLQELAVLARHPGVVLWGEIGLDYHYNHSPGDIQRRLFRRQLQLAGELNLPVCIHCRDAWDDLECIVREESSSSGRARGILHSFTGTRREAETFAALGFLISFSGMITFKNAAAIREAAQALRLDQVLVETDCPYLAPVPHRGRRNEPAFVVDVARGLAQAMGVSYEDLARETLLNLRRLIGEDDNYRASAPASAQL
ncbi:MAG: TatD family hydrolase [Acidobacteria bacterium]|nr:TatD family hydrolase [Acidobacteriota bacterium]